ncbi:hypothetical protein H2200_005306 [Cladophialophora chaetospira]|uniref:Uncharacterized protein n=1 Tax=Cladophialophora chaetospira TaxID=386627 RepID=A0AA39CIT7_9EURO|nr:hypothetical protein H2200_005306 [Cladophialophora chaetospira]
MCGVYQVDTDGTILSLNSNTWLQDVKAPECLCGAPLTGTRRYRIQSKLVNLNDTLDLLIAKLGRKLGRLSTAVGVQEKQLSDTFESFLENIRPNPLAAKANTAVILRRTREILDLQKHVVEIRELVADAIQLSLAHLHDALPNIVPEYALMFHLHLDVLEYRIVSVRLADALKIGQQLLSLQDPSFGVQRQGLKMIEFVHKESIAFVGFCKKALGLSVAATSPAIESEIRLQQLQFLLFAKSTRVRLADLGSPIEDTDLTLDDIAIKASLSAVAELGRLSPGNCASFVQTARDFASSFADADDISMLAPIPPIRNDYVRQTEKLWAEHKLGHLTICKQGHVYSSKTFFESCPDCEKHAKLSGNEVFRKSGKHLFENRFLEAMYARPPECSSTGSPKSKSSNIDEQSDNQALSNGGVAGYSQSTTSAEERFLSMMHKGLPKIQGGRAPSEAKKNQVMAADKDGPISGAEGELEAGEGKVSLAARKEEGDGGRTAPLKQPTMEEKFLVAMRRVKDAMPVREVNGS